ncbi:hypothetical protein DRN34_00030 [Thermococci archaeon]|nr:MAG: hypothetical protein DRN34_00030 [Thermococci archaeon]
MSKDNAYIWFSGATDVTGQAIAEALGVKCGRTKPKNASLVIGWGAKTKESVNLGKTPVLNHPNNIRTNRNKLAALDVMQDANVKVPKYAPMASALAALDNNTLSLPVIARKKYHQGGKGFWLCPMRTNVTKAADQGAGYIQELIEVKTEFRLHVFADKVLHAVKKVERSQEELQKAYVRKNLEKMKNIAAKKEQAFDEATAIMVLERQAKQLDGADETLKNNIGWKFSKITKVNKDLEVEAIKAVGALGLQFGAVDCVLDIKGKPWIIEVNTGPGLEESPFKAYVKAFDAKISEILAPKTTAKAPAAGKKTTTKATKAVKAARMGSALEKLKSKGALMANMIDSIDSEEEATVLDGVFAKMFGKD